MNVTIHIDDELLKEVRLIGWTLKKILHLEEHMSKELDDLLLQVQELDTVGDSVITLLNGISALLVAAKDDPVQIQAAADQIKVQIQDFKDAVVANTPAEEEPPV